MLKLRKKVREYGLGYIYDTIKTHKQRNLSSPPYNISISHSPILINKRRKPTYHAIHP